MTIDGAARPTEIEFQQFLGRLLRKVFSGRITQESRLGPRAVVDFLIDEQTPAGLQAILIEAKRETPQTSKRLGEILEQLTRYRSTYIENSPDLPRPRAVLAVPDEMTAER